MLDARLRGQRHPVLNSQHVTSERLTVRIRKILAPHLERPISRTSIPRGEVLDAMRAIGFGEDALAKRRPSGQWVPVELEQLVSNAEACLVEVRILRNDGNAQIGKLDSGALQEVLSRRIRCESHDTGLE